MSDLEQNYLGHFQPCPSSLVADFLQHLEHICEGTHSEKIQPDNPLIFYDHLGENSAIDDIFEAGDYTGQPHGSCRVIQPPPSLSFDDHMHDLEQPKSQLFESSYDAIINFDGLPHDKDAYVSRVQFWIEASYGDYFLAWKDFDYFTHAINVSYIFSHKFQRFHHIFMHVSRETCFGS